MSQLTGIPERIKTSDGKVLTKDVGRIVFATVWDANGTPDDRGDDEFISEEIIFEAGRHPEAESGFERFCEVVVPALT